MKKRRGRHTWHAERKAASNGLKTVWTSEAAALAAAGQEEEEEERQEEEEEERQDKTGRRQGATSQIFDKQLS